MSEQLPASATGQGPDEPIRGEMRVLGYRRVSHGLFLQVRDGLSEEEEFRRDLRAWLAVLPEGAVFTHVTGARLRGWSLPKLPEQVPVFAAVEGDVSRPRRPGLICSRLRRSAEATDRHGLPVDSSEEILLRAARDLGLLDLTIMLDSALRLGDIDRSGDGAALAERPSRCAAVAGRLDARDGKLGLRWRDHPQPVPRSHRSSYSTSGGDLRRSGKPGGAGRPTGDRHRLRPRVRRRGSSQQVATPNGPPTGARTGRHTVRPPWLHPRRPAQPSRRDDARDRPSPRPTAQAPQDAALATPSRQLAVLGKGPTASAEPLAPRHGGLRLVTNRMTSLHFSAVGDQTAALDSTQIVAKQHPPKPPEPHTIPVRFRPWTGGSSASRTSTASRARSRVSDA